MSDVPQWLDSLVEAVTDAMTGHSVPGPVGFRYREEDGWRPPVVLERSLWPDLMALTGDAGARQLFEKQPHLVETVLAGGRPDDVDTPEDYDKIIRLFPRQDSR